MKHYRIHVHIHLKFQKNINRLIAQVISNITSGSRFKDGNTADFIEFQINLVPFPRIHFLL
jgi:tubulin alpha